MRRWGAGRFLVLLVVILVSAFLIVPVFISIIGSFSGYWGLTMFEKGLTLRWYAYVWENYSHTIKFSVIIAAATVIGFGLGFTGIDAIHMAVWSAVLNGIVAVPIMAMMMVIVANSRLMGRFRARPWLIGLGWVGSGRD